MKRKIMILGRKRESLCNSWGYVDIALSSHKDHVKRAFLFRSICTIRRVTIGFNVTIFNISCFVIGCAARICAGSGIFAVVINGPITPFYKKSCGKGVTHKAILTYYGNGDKAVPCRFSS